MSDHIADTRKMVEGEDPCAGCVKRRPDGNYSWDCLECKRWWPDKYESSANAK